MFFSPGPSAFAGGMAGAQVGGKPFYGGDLESGSGALYPGITTSEQGLRWGFIRKVRVAKPRGSAWRARRCVRF